MGAVLPGRPHFGSNDLFKVTEIELEALAVSDFFLVISEFYLIIVPYLAPSKSSHRNGTQIA